MPRGVPGSGPFAGRKRPPKPSRAKRPAAPVVAAAAPPAPAAPPATEPHLADTRPLGSVNVDDLSGEVLKRYALRAGVHHRDVAGLSEDRLRQNVKLVIAEHFDLITEG